MAEGIQVPEAAPSILLRLRPSRKTAIEIGALVLIVALAIMVRVLPLQYGAYFTAYDPLFQYRSTEYVVENGYRAWFSWHDDLSWYPMGRDVAGSAYPGVPFTAAFVYSIARIFMPALTVYDACLFFPVLMGAVCAVAAYFLGKEIGGKPMGLFASIFISVNPSYMNRTALGFFDTESIGILCMVLIPLFFLRSIEESRGLNHRVVYGVLSGLSLGYIFASWGAAKYANGLLILYMLILMYTERLKVRHIISYCLTIGLGYAMVFFVPKLGIIGVAGLDHMVGFAMVPLMILYIYLQKKVDMTSLANIAGIIVLIGVVSVFLLPAVGIEIPLGYKFLKVLNPLTGDSDFVSQSNLYLSIAENRTVNWASLFRDFSLLLVLGILGVYFTMNDPNEKNIYLALFFMTSLYFAAGMARLDQILAPAASLMAAYGLVTLVNPFFLAIEQVEETGKKKRRRQKILGVNRMPAIFFISVLMLSLVPYIWSSAGLTDQPTSLAASGVPVTLGGEYPQDWPMALEWIKENVEDDEVICSWWDYGYWIEAMAGKKTMADGATQSSDQIANIGKIMMLPPEESIEILAKYGADYILVFNTYNPNNPQTEWPYGDNVKWSWMVNIGGLNITDYRDYANQGQPTETFYNSTIAELMYGGVDTEFFTPVYYSRFGFVKIFEVKYPE